jgi:hypothetical protein
VRYYAIFNGDISTAEVISSRVWMIMNGEWGGIWNNTLSETIPGIQMTNFNKSINSLTNQTKPLAKLKSTKHTVKIIML